MAGTVEELENDIRELSTTDRMHLLRDLVADLDGLPEPDIEEAWLVEAQRRYEELKSGAVSPVPADEVFARARARLKG